MGILGMNDMKQFALPAGWDGTEVMLQEQLGMSGVTYGEMINDIAAALILKAQMMSADPVYGALISFTDEVAFEYRQGLATTGMDQRTEGRSADARRGETIGHMLPLKSYDRALDWTWDFLRSARRRQFDADIATAMYDVSDEFERRILTRFFSIAENQLGGGGTGFDLPLANAGSTVIYIPTAFDGKTFASTHTHFDRQTVANRLVAINAGVETIREHGIRGPYTGIVPEDKIATYRALAGFVTPDRSIQYFRGATDANVAAIDEDVYFGMIEVDRGVVLLQATPRLDGNDHLGLYHSYGMEDPRNPVAVRFASDLGQGPIMKPDTVQIPLREAVIVHEYGAGIQGEPMIARLNGYACRFAASGNYTDPTIS